MERLTDKCWRNFDPWECCGQDNFCTRGCHDLGGCTGGCIVPKLYARLGKYEDTGITPERAQELAKAEKDGRLEVLPCKVGDTVYEANKCGFVSTYEVISIHVSAYSILIGWDLIDGVYSNLNGFEVSALGKTVFLTREEADAALKKREAGNETD